MFVYVTLSVEPPWINGRHNQNLVGLFTCFHINVHRRQASDFLISFITLCSSMTFRSNSTSSSVLTYDSIAIFVVEPFLVMCYFHFHQASDEPLCPYTSRLYCHPLIGRRLDTHQPSAYAVGCGRDYFKISSVCAKILFILKPPKKVWVKA